MPTEVWVTWVVWITTAASVVGAVLVLYCSLLRDRSRGRRRCPRCWYDMSGTPGSRTCSECGHLAASERAMYRTRKRWRWAAFGMTLVIAAVVLIAYGPTDPQAAKPIWWLAIEASSDDERGALARRELIERGRDGRLSVAQQRRLADRALAVQADPDAVWRSAREGVIRTNEQWGTLFEEAWQRDALTGEQIEQYLRTGFGQNLTFRVRPRTRAGEVIRVRSHQGWPRLAADSPRRIGRISLVATIESVDGADGFESPFGRLRFGSNAFGGGAMPFNISPIDTVGEHEIRVRMRMAAVPEQVGMHQPQHDDPFRNALVQWQREEIFSIEVLPPDASSVERVDRPELESVIRDAIRVELELYKVVEVDGRQYGTRPALVLFDTIPIDVSFDVFARAGDREEHLGAIYARGNRDEVQRAHGIRRDPINLFPDDDVVDVIFRTSPTAAKRTVDIEAVWDGEIIVEGVRLRDEVAARARDYVRDHVRDSVQNGGHSK